MTPLKLVFLDVDGVLNDREILFNARHAVGRDEHMKAMVGKKYVELVNDLVHTAKAHIVMSSTWRRLFDDMTQLREFFAERGLDTKLLIGRTPTGYWRRGQKFSEQTLRGLEIQDFLSSITPSRDVESIVILDDDGDMAHLKHRLVQTNGREVGLTQADVEKALELFNTKDDAHLTFDWDLWAKRFDGE